MTASRFRVFSAAIVVIAGLTTPAFAGGRAQTISWTGFYGGINAGYGWARTSSTIAPNAIESGTGAGNPAFNPLPGDLRPDGFTGGIQIGFNKQFNSFVAGIEADLSYADLDETKSATGPVFIGGNFQTGLETRLNWYGTVRGRLGVLAADNLLLYSTGGAAFSDAKTTLTATNAAHAPGGCAAGAPYCTNGASATSSIGWALGGGVEYALTSTWNLKAEYLHLDFGSETMTAVDANTPGGEITATAKVRVDIVRLGLNYRFN
jgi:outer membrane immunogenic protein